MFILTSVTKFLLRNKLMKIVETNQSNKMNLYNLNNIQQIQKNSFKIYNKNKIKAN